MINLLSGQVEIIEFDIVNSYRKSFYLVKKGG